jgi:hypothetical protein
MRICFFFSQMNAIGGFSERRSALLSFKNEQSSKARDAKAQFEWGSFNDRR